jgi:hypothetical protein
MRLKTIYKRLIIYFISIVLVIKFIEQFKNKINKNKTFKNLQHYSNEEDISQNYKWVINNRIYQYSTSFIIKTSNFIDIESIIISKINETNTYIIQNLRCVVNYQNEIIELNISRTVNYFERVRKIICTLNIDKIPIIDNLSVAIVDINDYKLQNTNDQLTANDLKSEHRIKLPINYIKYQLGNKINLKNEKKIKGIGHCVHYSYNINTQLELDKILNWIRIQENFGIKKIILYDANSNDFFRKTINSAFNSSFVEIRPYDVTYEAICNSTKLKYYESHDQLKYIAMRDICESAFYKFYSNPSYQAGRRWRHQKVTANDCYSSLMYIYEFVTHYDFDEYIFPRTHDLHKYVDLKYYSQCSVKPALCNQNNTLSLYDYTVDLAKKNLHGKPINRLSSIYFRNAIYLQKTYYLDEFINDLGSFIVNKSKLPFSIHLKFSHESGHFFLVKNVEELEYSKKVLNIYKNIECLTSIDNLNLTFNIDTIFKRFIILITKLNHRLGKSIYYTDNVEAIFTHYTLISKKNTEKISLSEEIGVSSHFRNDFYALSRDLQTSIKHFKFDFEYYYYIISKYSNNCFFK